MCTWLRSRGSVSDGPGGLGVPVGHLLEETLPELVTRLPDGVHNSVSRSHVPINAPDNFIWCSLNLLPLPSHGAPNLVL